MNELLSSEKCEQQPKCEVFIDNQPCYPGQLVSGKVECTFPTEKKIKGIQVMFEGQAHVQVGRKGPIVKDEKYCCTYINVMKDNRDIIHCHPGKQKYHFSLHIPHKIPSSIVVQYGYIAYWVTAVVDFIGDDIIRDKKRVTVGSYLDLNAYSVCKKPIHRYIEKSIMCGICTIVFEIKLLQGGYVPSQAIKFISKIENMSNINVRKVRFKILQIFKMYTQDYQQQHIKMLGKEEDLEDSYVSSGSEKTWTVSLQIPSDVEAPDLTGCTIIKMQCEIIVKLLFITWVINIFALRYFNSFYSDSSIAIVTIIYNNGYHRNDGSKRCEIPNAANIVDFFKMRFEGTVVLPFPYQNIKLRVPFYLGTVPITSSAI